MSENLNAAKTPEQVRWTQPNYGSMISDLIMVRLMIVYKVPCTGKGVWVEIQFSSAPPITTKKRLGQRGDRGNMGSREGPIRFRRSFLDEGGGEELNGRGDVEVVMVDEFRTYSRTSLRGRKTSL